MNDIIFGKKYPWLGLILLLPGLAILWDSIQLTRNANALDASTATAQATITDRYVKEEPCNNAGDEFNKGCRSEVLYGAFTYTVSDKTVTDEVRIGHTRPELTTQDTFTVTYLPDSPSVWQIDKGDYAGKAKSNIVVGLAMTMLGLFVIWAKGGFDPILRRLQR